jgi:hypothetical protein
VIVWLEDPTQWKYLRESTTIRGSRRGWKRGAELSLEHFYKLVGYELVGRVDKGMFMYRIFWLKTYDFGCPEDKGVYGFDPSGGGLLHRPIEGRLVSELIAKEKANYVEGQGAA